MKKMKLKKLIILLLPAMALLFARCGQDEGICIGSTGKTVIQDRTPLPYHSIEVYDNINLILTQDSSINSIRVEAGENLIDGITTTIDSGRLVLRNTNSCNWLRRFEIPVNVYLTFTKLDTLIFRAAGNITCTNAWENDSIYFDVIEGGGQIDLKLDVFKSFLYVRYGTVTVNVTGFSQVTYISSMGYGPLHAENLNSKFTYVSTFSPNDVFVNAIVELSVEIGNIGNVYYRGDPVEISTNISGEGKLIKF
jgi:hypothetical protein